MRCTSPALSQSPAASNNPQQGMEEKNGTTESLFHDELSSQTDQTSAETEIRGAEREKPLSASFANQELSGMEAKQEAPKDPVDGQSYQSIVICEPSLGPPGPLTEAQSLSPTKPWGEFDAQPAALVASVVTAGGESQAMISLEGLSGGTPQEHETHEELMHQPILTSTDTSEEPETHGEGMLRPASASPDASEEPESPYESTNISAPSAQRVSQPPDQRDPLRRGSHESQFCNPRPADPVQSNIISIPRAQIVVAGTRTGQFLDQAKTSPATCRMQEKVYGEADSDCRDFEDHSKKVSWLNMVVEPLPSLQVKESILIENPRLNSRSHICSLAHILSSNPDPRSNRSADLHTHLTMKRTEMAQTRIRVDLTRRKRVCTCTFLQLFELTRSSVPDIE